MLLPRAVTLTSPPRSLLASPRLMTVRREDPVLTSSRREAWLVFFDLAGGVRLFDQRVLSAAATAATWRR